MRVYLAAAAFALIPSTYCGVSTAWDSRRIDPPVPVERNETEPALDRLVGAAQELGWQPLSSEVRDAAPVNTIRLELADDECVTVAAAGWGLELPDEIRIGTGNSDRLWDSAVQWSVTCSDGERELRVHVITTPINYRDPGPSQLRIDVLVTNDLDVARDLMRRRRALDRTSSNRGTAFERVSTFEFYWRYASTQRSTLKGLRTGALVFFVVFVLLAFAFRSGRGTFGRNPTPRLSTARRVSLALPVSHARLVDSLASQDLSAAQRVRDQLVELTSFASAGLVSAQRTEYGRAHMQFETWDTKRGLEPRGDARARPADYREAQTGLVVVTLLVLHRCELPNLGPVWSRETVVEALKSMLPTESQELLRWTLHIRPPMQRPFDPAELSFSIRNWSSSNATLPCTSASSAGREP